MKSVEIDAARVMYVDVGQGEPVVLLHGYPQSHQCWRHQIGPLSRRWRVIAPDWSGWGRSERCLAVCPEYQSEVGRIGQFLEALGLERVNLVTHDYGGFLGLGFAIDHPERIRRFAILNSRAHRTFPQPGYALFAVLCWLARTPARRKLLQAMPIGTLHRRLLAPYVRRGCFDRAQQERYIGWMDTPAGRRWFAHFFQHYELATRPKLVDGLGSVACPSAVIWGDQDPYCPWINAEELGARMPRAELTRIHGADHYVMEERPADVLDALERLLLCDE